VVKLGDFGLAVEYNGIREDKQSAKKKTQSISSNTLHSSKVGTPFYLSPE